MKIAVAFTLVAGAAAFSQVRLCLFDEVMMGSYPCSMRDHDHHEMPFDGVSSVTARGGRSYYDIVPFSSPSSVELWRLDFSRLYLFDRL